MHHVLSLLSTPRTQITIIQFDRVDPFLQDYQPDAHIAAMFRTLWSTIVSLSVPLYVYDFFVQDFLLKIFRARFFTPHLSNILREKESFFWQIETLQMICILRPSNQYFKITIQQCFVYPFRNQTLSTLNKHVQNVHE